MSKNSVMYRFIRNWASLVESQSGEPQNPGHHTVCFFDGGWHDSGGNPITLSREDELRVVETISKIESANYSETPSLVMMDDVESLEDIADYLECDIEDMFLFFRFPTSQLREYKSPSASIPELAGGLYFLASSHEYEDDGTNIPWVEIADISGSMDNASVFGTLLRLAFSWFRSRKVKVVASNCREKTSNRLFKSGIFLKRFEDNGYVKISDVDRVEKINGENFHLNILVDEEWWNVISPDEKSEIVDLIDMNL